MRIVGVSSAQLPVVGCAFLIAAALSACGGSDTSESDVGVQERRRAVCDRYFQFSRGRSRSMGTWRSCNSTLSTLAAARC